jgi:choline kinase
MLDTRFPQSSKEGSDAAPDEEVEREIENEVTRLQHETRLWRLANSAQWVMWGVLKAKVPDLPDFDDPTQSAAVAAGPHTSQISMSSGTLPTMQSPIKEEEGSDPMDAEAKHLVEEIHDRRPDVAEEGDDEDTEEFDYLGYTWERAMFFWGDAVVLGLVKKEDLPEDVRKNLKVVED